MPRISHGSVITLQQIDTAVERILQLDANFNHKVAGLVPIEWTSFDYLLLKLQDDREKLLPEHADTVTHLRNLGRAMSADVQQPSDSGIPSAYTYFGQFVDHDITFEAVTRKVPLNDKLSPMSLDEARKIKNTRTAKLDLDSVYGGYCHDGTCQPAPGVGEKMLLGPVVGGATGADLFRDLPRDPSHDRAARIGDGRNDETLMISQLHVAFLRAHNAIVERGHNFEEARKLLRRHYQWIVLHDFLDRICHPETLEKVRAAPEKFYNPPDDRFFMPLEFTVAAYRFGHSMVRHRYAVNNIFVNESLIGLFMLETIGNYEQLHWDWIVNWERFVDGGTNIARKIDTSLVEPLRSLRDETGQPMQFETSLAVRNLLRGYLLRMPTGQAVADYFELTKMSEAAILSVATDAQAEVLEAANFLSHTPLWFYILAEGAAEGGRHLGPVGTALVAPVLIGLARRSDDSYLSDPGWLPTLGPDKEDFTLPDLLRLAGVLA